MKKFLFVAALLGFALFASAEDVMKISIDHFSVKVPLGWYALYAGSPTVFQLFSPLEADDSFQENANLMVEKLPRLYTVKEYQDASIQYLPSLFSDFQVIERQDNYHIYHAALNQVEIVGMQMIFIKEKEAYTITFSAKPDTFERFRDSFFAIAQSFTY